MSYRHQHKTRPTMRSDISVLLALCVFAFLILGTFVLVKFLPDTSLKIGQFFSALSNSKADPATLGVVRLGTTFKSLKNRFANAITGINATGIITLAFERDKNRYLVWYSQEGPYRIAYKASQSLEIRGMSENKYLDKIIQRYGSPSLSSCSKRLADGMRNCQFRWWLPGKIRLDINSRQNPNASARKLKITTQITDTQLSGRLRRTIETVRSSRSQ